MFISRKFAALMILLSVLMLTFAPSVSADEINNNISGDDDSARADSSDVVSSDIVLIGTIITPGDLGSTQVGKYYSRELQTMGDAIWTQTGGTLPEGLRLSESGMLQGTPLKAGRYEFMLKAAFTSPDMNNNNENKNFTLWITEGEGVPPVIITDYELEDGSDGEAYNVKLEAEGYGGQEVTWPLTWEVTGGSLPEGLSLSPSGVIFGEPSIAGTFLFTITVTNPADKAYRVFNLNIRAKSPKIITRTIKAGMLEDLYEVFLESEGSKPIKWNLSEGGRLPEGLILDSLNGKISGIPTEAGTFVIKIEASNSAGVDEKEFALEIEDPGLAITPANFPDKAFREYIELTYDKDQNGYLDNDEIKFVVDMELNSLNISSLEGIKYFTELVSLKCSKNNLAVLDLSQNKNLQYVHCMANNINALNVTGNENLLVLNAYANNLSALDLSHNSMLEILDVSYNRLAELDLSENINLEELNCAVNNLESINLADNISLIEADFASNDLTELDVSKNLYLKSLQAGQNKLTKLDLNENINLEYLDCSNNAFRELNLESNTGLVTAKYDSQLSQGLRISKTGEGVFSVNLAQAVSNPEKIINTQEHKVKAYNHDGELISESGSSSNAVINYSEIPAAVIYEYDTGFVHEESENNYMDVTFRVNEAPEIITQSNAALSLDVKAGSYFSYKLDATGDVPIKWSLSAGSLPDGLALTESGDIKGIPERSGLYEFEVTAMNNKGTDSKMLALNVKNFAPVITSENLPYGRKGINYNFALETDINESFTWSIIEGSLPAGLSLTSSGTLTGTPEEGGIFNFTVRAALSQGSDPAMKAFSLEVIEIESENYSPVITTSVLEYANAGFDYNFLIEAWGEPDIIFRLTSGRLPDGLRLASDGRITGIARESGRFNITVEAVNNLGSSKRDFILNVRPSIITNSNLSDMTISSSRNNIEFKLYGSNPAMTWRVVEGRLPDGLSLNINTGAITGRPTVTGDKSFVIRAEIAGWSDLYDEKTFYVKIKGIAAKINTIALQQGIINTRYNFTLKASGTGQIKWQASGLPKGLSLRYNKYKGTATISGTPLQSGKFNVKFTVSGTWGSQVKTLPLIIKNTEPYITTSSVNAASIGSYYNFAFRADGAAEGDALVWEISWSGNDYIYGLKFDPQGRITGTPSGNSGRINKPGEYKLNVRVSNSAGSDKRDFTIKLNAADEKLKPLITTTSLKNAVIGSSYNYKLNASGSGITWRMSWEGKKIIGLKIDSESGMISGVPSESNKSGSYKVKITANNFAGSASKTFVIILNDKAASAKTAIKSKSDNQAKSSRPVSNYESESYSESELEDYDDIDNLEDLHDHDSESDSESESESESKTESESESESDSENKTEESELPEDLKDLLLQIEGKEYIAAVVFPQITAQESGQYEFEATLNKHVKAGSKLFWFARPVNAVESEDDEIVDFYDKNGNPIEKVPEDHAITVSPWLRSDVVYQPIVAVEAK
ncbi:MAG: putative Ig domain-containing protein [Synergistaceae bacterium]|nr:putative Ig domain-containing protein [Synergistaceae bacterium]